MDRVLEQTWINVEHLRGSTVIVASKNILDKAPGLQAAWGRARRTALQEIRRDGERYYQFHAEVSGFPIAVLKTSHPISQFAEVPYPAEGIALLNGTRKFLLAENSIREDVDLAQWRGASAA
jgi:sulfonate transport system substrate-binding protein